MGARSDAGEERRQRFVQARQHQAKLGREARAALFSQPEYADHVVVREARLQVGLPLDLRREGGRKAPGAEVLHRDALEHVRRGKNGAERTAAKLHGEPVPVALKRQLVPRNARHFAPLHTRDER